MSAAFAASYPFLHSVWLLVVSVRPER